MRHFVLPLVYCILISAATALRSGKLPKSFVESPDNPPPWQYHAYNNNTYILRQSGFTDYEKPFLYMLFGEEKVFLLDTGSRNGHPAPIIAHVISEYISSRADLLPALPHLELLKRTSRNTPLELVIGHSHDHWDHTAGDAELSKFTHPNISKTTLIPPMNFTAITTAYSIASWPKSLGKLDLGKRVLDIIPLPGHTKDSIAVYDRETGILLTGDSVYPGRISIPQSDIAMFKASHARLERFVKGRDVSWVLGCHVEQKKTAGEDYPEGTVLQPDEHVLQFPVGVLEDVRLALDDVDEGTRFGQIMFDEFSLVIIME